MIEILYFDGCPNHDGIHTPLGATAMTAWVTTFAASLLAAVLAVAGNSLQLHLQDRAKRREEGRSLIRSLHTETVDTVTDLDLFMRSIRPAAWLGRPQGSDKLAATRELIESRWEGDLLRRLRRLQFGHPAPEIRAAVMKMEESLWSYVVAAGVASDEVDPDFAGLYTYEVRQRISQDTDKALVRLKHTVYQALYQEFPKSAATSAPARSRTTKPRGAGSDRVRWTSFRARNAKAASSVED